VGHSLIPVHLTRSDPVEPWISGIRSEIAVDFSARRKPEFQR